MIQEYEQSRPFMDYLTVGSHGRTGVYMTTPDSTVAEEKRGLGWICERINGGFWLRAPDISLIDITEPTRIYQLGDDDKKVFTAFQYLRDLHSSEELPDYIHGVIFNDRDRYEGFQFFVSEGEVLEGEIRIGGSDSRVKQLKQQILSETQKEPVWNRYMEQTNDFLGRTKKIELTQFDDSSISEKTMDFLTHIRTLKEFHYPHSEDIGKTVIPNIVQQLPEFDVMVFIPTGCFRYLTSFLDEQLINKIMVWEVHYDENRMETLKIINKGLENRRCLIIDKSYTGKTLERAAHLIADEGGIPIRLGLFPKSRIALPNLEYVMLLDDIQPSSLFDHSDPRWLENNYKRIMSLPTAV